MTSSIERDSVLLLISNSADDDDKAELSVYHLIAIVPINTNCNIYLYIYRAAFYFATGFAKYLANGKLAAYSVTPFIFIFTVTNLSTLESCRAEKARFRFAWFLLASRRAAPRVARGVSRIILRKCAPAIFICTSVARHRERFFPALMTSRRILSASIAARGMQNGHVRHADPSPPPAPGVSCTRLVFMAPRTSVTVCKSILTYSLARSDSGVRCFDLLTRVTGGAGRGSGSRMRETAV